eukprot:3940667-Rhodomonas_salina.1
MAQGRGSRVEGQGSRVEGRGSRVEGVGSGVYGLGSRVKSSSVSASRFGDWVLGLKRRVAES